MDRKLQLVARRTCGCMIRDISLREDAEQEVLFKLSRMASVGTEIREPFVVTVSRNVCRDILRRTLRENRIRASVSRRGSYTVDVQFMLDLETWMCSQSRSVERVVRYVVFNKGQWDNLSVLSKITGCSRATCSRVLDGLREFLTSYSKN